MSSAARPSFAKVAASVSSGAQRDGSSPHPTTNPREDIGGSNKIPPMAGPVIANGGSRNTTHMLSQYSGNMMPPPPPNKSSPAIEKIAQDIDDLSLQPKIPDVLTAPDGTPIQLGQSNQINRETGGSDESQRADSSSELGTKPPSLDGKSITSGTTFALDEKESLRPDDSASVKAAGDDDDAFSIRGSLIAGSRIGSDLAARARGIQLGDMPDRRLMQVTPGSSGHGILTPQSTSSEQPSRSGPEIPPLAAAEGSADALNLIYQHAPDEKLIEALSSPKDRLYLLRLEKEVINFVQNSGEPYIDLPPSNSFCRMLAHKLADYYHMTHSFEPNIGVVRIFRTPFCRVPTSLAQWEQVPTSSSTSTPPLPVTLPKKIMRRGQDGDGGAASTNPSKPTSEAGSDGKENRDKQLSNQKLTREEREEMYKQARERIFGNSEETSTDADKDNDASRASSISGNRSNASKSRRGGRHRRDDSDSFDSRHHYAPYWGPQQQTWVSQYGQAPSGQAVAHAPAVYAGQMPPGYSQQPMAYPAVSAMGANNGYPMYQAPQYPPQAPQQRYPSSGSPLASYGSVAPGTAHQVQQGQQGQQPPHWQQSYGIPPQAYPGRGAPSPSHPLHPGVPYAFGQLPANINPHDPKTQHPIPGSYNRNHSFNPKTQSFVPGGNGMPSTPGPQPPFTAPTSHHGSPQIGSTHPTYPGYQQNLPQPYGGHGMIRQASNNSAPGYHPQQHIPPPMPYGHQPPMPSTQHPHHPQHSHMNPSPPTHIPNRPNVPHQGPGPVFTHLPNYGNPATLPQKPATGI